MVNELKQLSPKDAVAAKLTEYAGFVEHWHGVACSDNCCGYEQRNTLCLQFIESLRAGDEPDGVLPDCTGAKFHQLREPTTYR